MKWNCKKSYCSFMIGLFMLPWYGVAAARKHRFEIRSLCNTTVYGSVLSTHNDIRDILLCTVVCMENSQCESCTYDEGSHVCSLNSVIRVETPTCTHNVKYAQKRAFKCVSVGTSYKICSLDLYAVPGEMTGYVEVKLKGVWSTVCDDYWSEGFNGIQNANVICRTFGYSDGIPIYPLRYNPVIYDGPILITAIACTGYETYMLQCPYISPSTVCSHYEDVAVRCY